MQKITNQSHNKDTFLYAISRMLERSAYYGLRAILVLYLTLGTFQLDRGESLEIYAIFTSVLLFGAIAGALLGDLLIGSKRAIIIGAILQTAGAFILCSPSLNWVYVGLSFIVIGGALYSPNLTANFGRSYLGKTKLLDSGFTILYLAINLGAFLGIFSIGMLGEKQGWNFGFIAAGILMLLSLVPLLFTNMFSDTTIETSNNQISPNPTLQEKSIFENINDHRLEYQTTNNDKNQIGTSSQLKLSKRIIHITAIAVLVSIYWLTIELSSVKVFLIAANLSEIEQLNTTASMWSYYGSVLLLPIAVIAIILWTYFYSSSYFKIMIGFISGAISVGILFTIPEAVTSEHAIIYIISLTFMGISEIHIGPMLHSALTKYGNPKYLAILMSLAFVPSRLFTYIIGLFFGDLYEHASTTIWVALILSTFLSTGLAAYLLISKSDNINRT